jgi:hypothetical protein
MDIVVPFLETPHLESQVYEVRLVRFGRKVQRALVCWRFSWRAWCGGDSGDGWAEVSLS